MNMNVNNKLKKVIAYLCSVSLSISLFSASGFANDALTPIVDEAALEEAYIRFVEEVTAQGEEVYFSFDAFVANYYESEKKDIDEYIEYAIMEENKTCEALDGDTYLESEVPVGSALSIDGVETGSFGVDSISDGGSNSERLDSLASAYDELVNRYDGLEMSYDTFIAEYESQESKTVSEYLDEYDAILQTDELYSSGSSAWYYNTGTSLPQRADYSQYGLL